MKLSKILVAVDYSACSKHALEYAGFLAQGMGAELHLLHAWDRPYYAREQDLVIGRGGGTPRTLTEVLEETAQEDMRAFIASASIPDGVTVHHTVSSGAVASVVVEHLKNGNHDLLITGTHGRTGFKHLLLGSVAERLVRVSTVPVLTVPPPPEQRGE